MIARWNSDRFGRIVSDWFGRDS